MKEGDWGIWNGSCMLS